MYRATFALILLAACSFRSHEVATTDGPMVDAPSDTAVDGPADAAIDAGAPGAFRKSLTIDKSKVKEALTDFPVWIDLTDADIATRAHTNGSDIFFTDASGNVLDHELVRFNRANQRVLAWVRAPSLDTTTSTVLYVVYGDPMRAVTPNPTGVFKAGYAAVWHLDDALATTTIADATNSHPGTAVGLAPAASVGGKLASGFSFDGSGTGYITFTNMLTTGAHTISAWVNQGQTTGHSAIVAVGTNNTDNARFVYGNYLNKGTLGIGQYTDDWEPAGNDLRGAGWKYVVYTLDGAGKHAHVFVDGAEITGSPHTMMNPPTTTGTTGYIAAAPAGFGAAGMLGSLDEVRIATVTRDLGWVATEYANQNNPGAFYTVGPEQPAP